MKTLRILFTICVFTVLVAGAAIVILRPQWIQPAAAEADEKAPETEVPVKVVPAKTMTVRQWVDAFGYIEPEPAREELAAGKDRPAAGKDRPAAGAIVASPVAGVIAEARCPVGKVVGVGDVLFQLDDRVAQAAEAQAKAAVDSANASLRKLRASPRPEQVGLAQLAVEKAKEALAFARKGYDRQQLLSKSNGVSEKVIEAAAHDAEVARNDLAVAEHQYLILKSSPTPEELAEAAGKVAEAEKALASAQAQRSVLQIKSPLKATVVRVMASAGEAVDPTRPLVELIDLGRLVVNVSVPADQLSNLHIGQAVEFLPDSSIEEADEHSEKPAAEKHDSPTPAEAKPAGDKPVGEKPGVEKLDKPAPEKAAAEKPATEKREGEKFAADKPAPEAPAPEKPAAPAPEPKPAPRGAIAMVGFQVDRKTNTVSITASLPAESPLRPGQFVRVRILIEEHPNVLAVPWVSIIHTEDEKAPTGVSIVHKEKATRVPVALGLRDGDWVEVKGEGLKAGDSIVTEGAYGLPKETKVHLIEPAKE